MTALERLVVFCSSLGIDGPEITFNNQNNQFQISLDAGRTHVRGCGTSLENAAKSVLGDLRNTIKLVNEEPSMLPPGDSGPP